MNFTNNSTIQQFFYSKELAMSQALQTSQLIARIQKSGIQEIEPLPHIYVLVKGGAVRWIMSDEGNHRAHASFALGYDSLLCRVKEVIHYETLEQYPSRYNADYDATDATIIFNKAFFGQGPIRGIV